MVIPGLSHFIQVPLSSKYKRKTFVKDDCRADGRAPQGALCLIHIAFSTSLQAQIQKHKYKYTNTNTEIQIHKYKYTTTNTQIQIHKSNYINTGGFLPGNHLTGQCNLSPNIAPLKSQLTWDISRGTQRSMSATFASNTGSSTTGV